MTPANPTHIENIAQKLEQLARAKPREARIFSDLIDRALADESDLTEYATFGLLFSDELASLNDVTLSLDVLCEIYKRAVGPDMTNPEPLLIPIAEKFNRVVSVLHDRFLEMARSDDGAAPEGGAA